MLLLIWQLGSAVGAIPADVLPAPSLIADAGLELIRNGQLVDALRVSGIRVTQGLVLGGLVGVTLGVAVGLSRWVETTVDPPMQMLRALPHLGLIPLFILWFGIGELPKVLLVALGVSFPAVPEHILGNPPGRPQALRNREGARVLVLATVADDHRSERRTQVLVGLRQSLAIAWLTLIVAEQINADKGIGFLINNARDFLRIDIIIFGLIVYALLGIATDAVVRAFERRALRYRS